MNRSDIAPLVPTSTFSKIDWAYNYPVQMHRDEETGEIRYVYYQPRKLWCVEMENPIPPEDVTQVCDNMITVLKTAILLYEKFRDGEIDSVYYWDTDMLDYDEEKRKKNGRNTEDGNEDHEA